MGFPFGKVLLIVFMFVVIGLTMFFSTDPFAIKSEYTCAYVPYNLTVCNTDKDIATLSVDEITTCTMTYETKKVRVCKKGVIEATSFSPFLNEDKPDYPTDYGLIAQDGEPLTFGFLDTLSGIGNNIWDWITGDEEKQVIDTDKVISDNNLNDGNTPNIINSGGTDTTSGGGGTTTTGSGEDYSYYEPVKMCRCYDKKECSGVTIRASITGSRWVMYQKCTKKEYPCDENPPVTIYYEDCWTGSRTELKTNDINWDNYKGNLCVRSRCVNSPLQVSIMELLNKVGIAK